jgi:hypothetical protein
MLALGQPPLRSSKPDAEGSLQHLQALILARNVAAWVQQDLDLKQLTSRLLAGLAELQVLTGEGVMQQVHTRLLLPPACTMPAISPAHRGGSSRADGQSRHRSGVLVGDGEQPASPSTTWQP